MIKDSVSEKPSVLVMMASYNGDKFISEQIESILAQKGVDVTLIICDDGSTDSTREICLAYEAKFSNVIYNENRVNKGLAKNFMDILLSDKANCFDYYAFSDQDDVWLPEKLYHAICILTERESEYPVLYYSDIENVNCNLSGGFREFSSWLSCAHTLIAVLAINWASGCTMVFNSKFRSLILEYEPNSYPRNHDGWLHLVAITCGEVVADLNNSYIKRRISGDNQVGQRDLERTESLPAIIKRWRRIFDDSNHCQTLTAEYLLKGYGDRMNNVDFNTVQKFASMPHSFIARLLVARELVKCPFPTRSLAFSFALKAIMNRL